MARALWHGWEEGAIADSAAAPAWPTPGAVPQVCHRGVQFDVRLAPTLPRSVRGHPVIWQTGSCGEGRDVPARNADVIFSAHGNDFADAGNRCLMRRGHTFIVQEPTVFVRRVITPTTA